MSEEFSYDRVTYPSFVFPQTSPHRLAAKGILYGMSPPDPRKCRYLDLGCGDGSSLAAGGNAMNAAEILQSEATTAAVALILSGFISIALRRHVVLNLLGVSLAILGAGLLICDLSPGRGRWTGSGQAPRTPRRGSPAA